MKTIKQFLLLTICVSFFVACEPYDIFIDDEYVRVTMPFEAEFLGTYTDFVFPPEANCEDIYQAKVFVDFTGTATPLGNMYGAFEFCAVGPPNPDLPPPTISNQYAPSESYMVAENGDKLFVTISGYVIQGRADDHPDYVASYWRDEFEIIGGTGRYEGATGGGMSDDYNSLEDDNSHHNWSGTITLVKRR